MLINIASWKGLLFCLTMNNLLMYKVMSLEKGTKHSEQLTKFFATVTLIWVELTIL